MAFQRLSEVANVGDFYGDKIQIRSMLGQDFLATRVVFRDGMGGKPFAIVQGYRLDDKGIRDDEHPFWFTCGAQNVVEALKRAENLLPVIMQVNQAQTARGRVVLTVF